MSNTWVYVCDHCGSIVTIEAAPIPEETAWECDDCGSNAMWEFTSKEAAMQHSRHITSLVRSGLVRRVNHV